MQEIPSIFLNWKVHCSCRHRPGPEEIIARIPNLLFSFFRFNIIIIFCIKESEDYFLYILGFNFNYSNKRKVR